MPNTENIQKWVDVLRSGDYEQGRGALARNGTYCCLGVACEVAITNGADVPRDTVETEESTETYYDDQSGYLPYSVMEWLGLYSASPKVRLADGNTDHLMTLNDLYKWTFKQIADAIEHTYL